MATNAPTERMRFPAKQRSLAVDPIHRDHNERQPDFQDHRNREDQERRICPAKGKQQRPVPEEDVCNPETQDQYHQRRVGADKLSAVKRGDHPPPEELPSPGRPLPSKHLRSGLPGAEAV